MINPPPLPKPPGLAVASLVLGITSFGLCLGALAGLPAIICGHLAHSGIKKSGGPGAGMAVAGLVLGYASSVLSVVILPVFAALAIPALAGAQQKANASALLAQAKQIGSAMESSGLVRVGTPPRPGVGYPADANIRSSEKVAGMLVSAGCLTSSEAAGLGFQKFIFGNVSESDPSDTILLRSKPGAAGGGMVVLLKSGDGRIVRSGDKRPFGKLPPRSPAFLDP